MKRRPAKKSSAKAPRDAHIEYELNVLGAFNDVDDQIEAELKSPALDSAMHAKSVVRVNIGTDVKKKPKPRAVLDSFHIESLLDYVRRQDRIRRALEPALIRDQQEWDPDTDKVSLDELWSRVKIESLELRRRETANPELVAHLRSILPPAIVKAELAGRDEAGTRSFFTLVLKCDWDDEHTVRADFRDGEFVQLDHV